MHCLELISLSRCRVSSSLAGLSIDQKSIEYVFANFGTEHVVKKVKRLFNCTDKEG